VLAVLVPLGWIVARALRVSRAELLGTVAGSLKLMLVPLGLAAIVAYALPPAPSWVLLIAEAAVYLVLCALGTWLLDRELVRFALRGGRERQPAAV
jgi:hypothetical protein